MYSVKEQRAELIAFDCWLATLGRSTVTGWRWRKRGWITTLNIAGRHYIQREEIDRFTARVKSGEFAQVPTFPAAKGRVQ